MKLSKKMISVNKLSNKACGMSAFKILTACLFSAVVALPMSANAQSSACAANETVQSYTFAPPNNWIAGSATINYTIGAGASAVTVSGTASLNDIVAGNPTTAQSGGFATHITI